MAAQRRGERHAPARRLRGGGCIAGARLVGLRAARDGPERLRPAVRELRNVRGEPYGAREARRAVADAGAAAACAGELERRLLVARGRSSVLRAAASLKPQAVSRLKLAGSSRLEIGRASCRERV